MSTLIVGCGYLGRALARRLRVEDPSAEVWGTTRSASKAEELARLGIRPVVADVLSPTTLAALPPTPRVVYCVGYDRSAGASIREVYADGLSNVLSALGERDWAGRLVHVSSTGVYGQDGGEWVDESSPTIPRTAGGVACLEAEGLLAKWSRKSGFSATSVRLSGIYGPGRIVRRGAIERGDPLPGDPDRWLNLIHVDDGAGIVAALLRAPLPDPIYLGCDDRPVRRREYYDLVAARIGAPDPTYEPVAAGSPEAAREDSNKRVSNRSIREGLGVALQFPDIATGVPDALARSSV